MALDPENHLYTRHLRRRLDAESLRDRILQATGELELKPAEGSVIRHRDILVNLAGSLHEPSRHRSVYLCFLRNSPPPELAAFDLPDGTMVTGKREVTALPAQSLFLMNSPFLVEQSRHLARHLLRTGGDDDHLVVTEALRRVLCRNPFEGEFERASTFISDLDAELQGNHSDAIIRKELAWAAYCQALLASSEFRYID